VRRALPLLINPRSRRRECQALKENQEVRYISLAGPEMSSKRRCPILDEDAQAGLSYSLSEQFRGYIVLSGGWKIGRIYQELGSSPEYKWAWAIYVDGPIKRSDRVASLEQAKAQLQTSWKQWRAWAKLG
jgi:hypothetical protein